MQVNVLLFWVRLIFSPIKHHRDFDQVLDGEGSLDWHGHKARGLMRGNWSTIPITPEGTGDAM